MTGYEGPEMWKQSTLSSELGHPGNQQSHVVQLRACGNHSAHLFLLKKAVKSAGPGHLQPGPAVVLRQNDAKFS